MSQTACLRACQGCRKPLGLSCAASSNAGFPMEDQKLGRSCPRPSKAGPEVQAEPLSNPADSSLQ